MSHEVPVANTLGGASAAISVTMTQANTTILKNRCVFAVRVSRCNAFIDYLLFTHEILDHRTRQDIITPGPRQLSYTDTEPNIYFIDCDNEDQILASEISQVYGT